MLNKIVFLSTLVLSTSAFATSLECSHKGFSDMKLGLEISKVGGSLEVTQEEIRSSHSPRVGETAELKAVQASAWNWMRYEGQTANSRQFYFGLKKADLQSGLSENFNLTVYISDENDADPSFVAYGMNCTKK
ncbi:MAG: hypothetical protein AB7H97_04200 [Pseudobdellovibrionaceae bacterium]